MASNFPVGERWTMVPCAALVERAGRSVIAVAGDYEFSGPRGRDENLNGR
ncbi:hypothetical protein F9C07_4177 [Aspergillus flavus]|uniref:Uncharacterized protein n=1 Tax=Aspergillus flavus (strain ATCC 200026 / FGSC A1120 / IAM 13836 / NRRL 3357 / JCM 12722 / SRRC 167) TaxID=332952 RepID=A0A7U2MJZ0_ASPFN|nr:hypothetical protein F9C07_4177 [Aspergillus flavus]